MKQDSYAVILVHSTNHALRVQDVLGKNGIAAKLVPVPRQLSSDCGVCVRVNRIDKETTASVLSATGLETDGLYDI
ncbi:MAG: DUF3343 domain-containing protein [Chitinispirillaceae bacterium]|nr:DUF3343 domain-containing protein [Chitinispirillaceae bacterium]